MKRVVITGATGAVGYALINELIDNQYEVYAICHKSSKRLSNLPVNEKLHVFLYDLNELLVLKDILPDCDYFYHLAWDGTYGIERDNYTKQLNNIKYTLDSVELAHYINCQVYIGVGSQSEFGNSDNKKSPYDSCFPNNFYGSSKLSASYLTRNLCNKYNIKHCWCRIFSLFGPFDGNYTLIMSSLNKMINNEDCNFTEGNQIWDYIYSKDAAVAFRLVAEKGKNNSIYCIASGKTRKLRDYILSMKEVSKSQSSLNFGKIPYYPHQVMNLSANISNLIGDTGFKCKYTFEEGILDLLKYIKKDK